MLRYTTGYTKVAKPYQLILYLVFPKSFKLHSSLRTFKYANCILKLQMQFTKSFHSNSFPELMRINCETEKVIKIYIPTAVYCLRPIGALSSHSHFRKIQEMWRNQIELAEKTTGVENRDMRYHYEVIR